MSKICSRNVAFCSRSRGGSWEVDPDEWSTLFDRTVSIKVESLHTEHVEPWAGMCSTIQTSEYLVRICTSPRGHYDNGSGMSHEIWSFIRGRELNECLAVAGGDWRCIDTRRIAEAAANEPHMERRHKQSTPWHGYVHRRGVESVRLTS